MVWNIVEYFCFDCSLTTWNHVFIDRIYLEENLSNEDLIRQLCMKHEQTKVATGKFLIKYSLLVWRYILICIDYCWKFIVRIWRVKEFKSWPLLSWTVAGTKILKSNKMCCIILCQLILSIVSGSQKVVFTVSTWEMSFCQSSVMAEGHIPCLKPKTDTF